MQMNVMEQLLFLINDTVKQVPMDGDENGLQDAKTTLLIWCSRLTLIFKFGNCEAHSGESNIYWAHLRREGNECFDLRSTAGKRPFLAL